jgi:23S rRNA pseudouridine1911/1915/1917 synthase
MELKILYEDNHIIAVYKPAGLLVQGDESGARSLMDEVRDYLKEKYNKPGKAFLGMVHRLDRNVSGIVLFGKTSKGASRLSEQFRSHDIRKIYSAVVEGELKNRSGKLIHFLKKDEARRRAFISDASQEGYDQSELEYEVLKSNKNYTLVIIDLRTGRFHQIRSQFSHIGHPIAGDSKYGSKIKMPSGHLALCATEVNFKTATTDEAVVLKVDRPEEWNSLIN